VKYFCGRSPPAAFAARSRAPPHRLARRRACQTLMAAVRRQDRRDSESGLPGIADACLEA
ncbi:hypothetical protein ACU4GD_30615, partial [Cupriavidus basilensis]